MFLLVEGKDFHCFILFAAAKLAYAIAVDLKRTSTRQSKCSLHHLFSVALTTHSVEHRCFRFQRREVVMADGSPAEGCRDRLVGPDQFLLKVYLVVGAELRGGLPVFIPETRPRLELLTNFCDVQFVHIRHLDLQWNSFLLPVQECDG